MNPTTDAGRRAQAAMRTLSDIYWPLRPSVAGNVAARVVLALDAIDIAAIEREAVAAERLAVAAEPGPWLWVDGEGRDSLSAAWAEAEAAMPEDFELSVTGHAGRLDLYMAKASYMYSLRHYRENVGPSRWCPFEMAHAATPAEALRALAAKLRETP